MQRRSTLAPGARAWLIALFCLLLVAQPQGLWAAPHRQAGELVRIEDPDDLFAVDVPGELEYRTVSTYQNYADGPLDGLVADRVAVIADPRNDIVLIAYFLRLDTPLEDAEAMADFAVRFQAAAGGDMLPDVELQVAQEGGLAAAGQTGDRFDEYVVRMEAVGDLVSVLTVRVDRQIWDADTDRWLDMIDSFTWSPEAAQALLVPTAADAEFERYSEPGGIFSVVVPTGLEVETEDLEGHGLGVAFYDPTVQSLFGFPNLSVSFAAAGNILEPEAEELRLYPFEDAEWADLVDSLMEGSDEIEVLAQVENPVERTLYLVLDTGAINEGGETIRLWLWYEEWDGILAVLTGTGLVGADGDDDGMGSTFHTALATLSWSPAAAASAIAEVMGAPDPAAAPVAFADPFGLVALSLPPSYPFQTAAFEGEALGYRFGTTPDAGVVTLNLAAPAENGYSDAEWKAIVDAVTASAVSALEDNELGTDAELISGEIGVPAVTEGHSALLRSRSTTHEAAIALRELDGVLATLVVILPREIWAEQEETFLGLLETPVAFEPAAVRGRLDAYAGLGVTLLGTTLTTGWPVDGQEIVPQFRFARDESITTIAGFVETGLAGQVDVVLQADNYPVPHAVFAVELADRAVATGDIVVKADDRGTRLALVYQPNRPILDDHYTSLVYYAGELLAAHRFRVTGSEPEMPALSTVQVFPGDPADFAPALATNTIVAGEEIYLRGTGDWPAGSQLRLIWTDPDGALVADGVQTLRIWFSGQSLYNWYYLLPEIAWRPGVYTWRLMLDGEEVVSDQLTVLEPPAEVPLDDGGAALLAGLPLPGDLLTAEPVQEVDLAVTATAEVTLDDILSTVGAYLRAQGWEQTLPVYSATLDFTNQRWVKDGYEFIVEPGAGPADQVWLSVWPAEGRPGDTPLTDATLAEAQELATAGIADERVADAAVSPNGLWLAVTTEEGTLVLFDARTLALRQFWRPQEGVYAAPIFSPDGTRLAVTLEGQGRSQAQIFDNFEVIWLPTTTFAGHTEGLTALLFSPDGMALLTGSRDGTVRRWALDGGTPPQIWSAGAPVAGLAVTPEDLPGVMAGLEGGLLRYWSPEGEAIWEGAEVAPDAPRLAVSPLVTGDGIGEMVVYGDGVAEWLAYAADGTQRYSAIPAEAEGFEVTSAAVSPDGSLSGVAGPAAVFYRSADGEFVAELLPFDVEGVSPAVEKMGFSPDGRTLWMVVEDGSLRLWGVPAP